MKNYLAISYITISLLLTAVASEDCDIKCVKKAECSAFGNLSKQDQDAWQVKYPCSSTEDKEYSKLFGFAPIAKGDFVCCSGTILRTTASTATSNANAAPSVNNRHPDYYGHHSHYQDPNSGYDYPDAQTPNNWGSDNNGNGNNIGYPNQGNPDYPYPGVNTPAPPKNYFNINNNPYVTSSPFFPVHGHGNSGGNANLGQCPVTSFPPKPETGCCGREASDSDRIIDRQKPPSYNDMGPVNGNTNSRPVGNGYPNSYDNSWVPKIPTYGHPYKRVARSADAVVPVTIGDRIAGGRETEFTQFPWTVLLQITFDYGNKRQAFNCGGSLLSSRYVLTAGHCVFDKGGKVVDIDIYLAEYDKSTFPKDCKTVLGQGQKCIENIVMKAQDFVLHPQYDDTRLNNDIALIRIQGNAPYTDYIRPICLPSIDIDNPEFFNLRLAVAGWGRNGRYRSNIKQSTIVNLVPQEKCKKFYPTLSKRQMCAAGYTGEDTCKGDSGGPLMTVYGGKYEVVGVVSGKRADSPCGTSVPSLYTSVYHYRDWIVRNMLN